MDDAMREKLRSARRLRDATEANFRAVIREAAAAGASRRQIGVEVGLSHARVDQIIHEQDATT